MASHDRRLAMYANIIGGLPRATTTTLQVRSIYGSFLKPLFDFIVTLIMVVPAAIIVSIFALIVMTDGHKPFYVQKRIGKNGRTFGMWKLRSMVPNADAVLEEYLSQDPAARREWDRTQKLKHDP
ncbi:MAG: sugar transferase, partial [Lentilitoribacter sp.]